LQKRRVNMDYMDSIDFDGVRLAAAGNAGENVLYAGEVARIIGNLGGKCSEAMVKAGLRGYALRVKDLISGKLPAGFLRETPVYRESDVWGYLKGLEASGDLDLSGIEGIGDIHERGYDQPPTTIADPRRFRKIPSGYRSGWDEGMDYDSHASKTDARMVRIVLPEDAGNSWDNAVRLIEDAA
jgi:hypothetical protein